MFLIIGVSVSVLFLALVLDLIFGDPSPNIPWKYTYRLHPTVWMGKLTKILKRYFRNANSKIEKFNGIFLAILVILSFALPVYFGLMFISTFSGFLGLLIYIVAAAILLKLTICIKLETDWAKAATLAIKSEDLVEAKKYSHFSRRDSKDLTGEQISSSVIESMAENLIDFKISPIFSFAFLGVSGAIAFRAINTLDGMVGFKDAENVNIGWFSANLDTIVNYLPARIAAILIVLASALIGEDYRNAWMIARRDNSKTPSRNHGWPMAAMAGALRIQLEKPGQYVLGEEIDTLHPQKILQALRIRNIAIALCIIFSLPIIVLTRFFFFPH